MLLKVALFVLGFLVVFVIGKPLQQDNTTTVVVVPQQQQTQQDQDSLYGQDFIECLENGQCGLESVCSFRFERIHSFQYDSTAKKVHQILTSSSSKHSNKKVEELPLCPPIEEENEEVTDEEEVAKWRALLRPKAQGSKILESSGACRRDVEGHIFGISNHVSYPITFYWDILDTITSKSIEQASASSGLPTKSDGVVFVPSGSTRYFIDTIYKTHTVRLLIGNQFVGETIAHAESKCKDIDACDFLYRLCYQYKEDQRRYSKIMPEGSIDKDLEYYCDTYTTECDVYASRKLDREQCFAGCMQTYMPEMVSSISESMRKHNSPMAKWLKKKGKLVGKGGGTLSGATTESNSRESEQLSIASHTLECMIETPEYKQFKDSKNTLTALTTTDTSSTSWVVSIVVLCLFIGILILLLLCWIPYWGRDVTIEPMWTRFKRWYTKKGVKEDGTSSQNTSVFYG
jgi:hypothetical protein